MARDRQRSSPLLESHDEPRAVSPALLEAHLEAHRQLEERLQAVERRSNPVRLGWRGLFVQGSGLWLVLLGVLALVAWLAWLYSVVGYL